MTEEEREELVLIYMNMSRQQLDATRQFIEEYEEVDQLLDKLIGLNGLRDKELVGIVEAMKCLLEDNCLKEYKEANDTIRKFENYDLSDLVSNEGL